MSSEHFLAAGRRPIRRGPIDVGKAIFARGLHDAVQRDVFDDLELSHSAGAGTKKISRTSIENLLWVAATTFVKQFPVGLVIALVSAGILRRKRGSRAALAVT